MTIKEVGLSDMVLDLLAQCFSRKPCEVKVCPLIDVGVGFVMLI